MIAAYAIGAHQAYIFVRCEYPLAATRMEQAIALLREEGLLQGRAAELLAPGGEAPTPGAKLPTPGDELPGDEAPFSPGWQRLNHCPPSSGQFVPALPLRTPPLAQAVSPSAQTDLEQTGSESGAQTFTGASLDITVVRSAGAYVCGEETALIKALEGRLPQPSKRPPYPVKRGLWGHPSVVNNVETLACVPAIIERGAQWFSGFGTEASRGTKVFSLTGKLERTGLVEVQMGTSIERVVCGIGGASSARAVQIGGPSGALLPREAFATPLDFESLNDAGAIIGSGGLIALGEDQCVVDLARYFTRFSAQESCGRCPACRDGLQRAAELLDGICAGQGTFAELEELRALAVSIPRGSLCGLGKSATRPLASALAAFRGEFAEHIAGHCPAHSCTALIHFEIDQTKCQGERCCLQTCPGNAIKGRFGKPGHIEQRLCLKCWTCIDVCPYGALRVL
jgi:NADH-quinone oxidoreductase subunit F